MGNYVSCASSAVPSNTVKVMHMNGRVEEFQRRIKAAELMLENARQFVCHSNALHIGRRITPLSADEDLEIGQLYFLLPMEKLHSVLKGSDMAALAFKANSAVKLTSKNTAKILPIFGDMRSSPPKDIDDLDGQFDQRPTAQELVVPKMNLEDLPGESVAFAKHRLSSCRSWKPKLETISETRLLQG